MMLGSILLVGTFGVVVSPQAQLDVCGCKNNVAALGNFDTLNASTYPQGTNTAVGSLQVPLPADGVLVFSNINLQVRPGESQLRIGFVRNGANTPATLLTSGNVTIGPNVTLTVSGDNSLSPTTDVPSKGGLGGPGAFRGGDGAYLLVNFAKSGGAGLGPGGGAGATTSHAAGGGGAHGTFPGGADLLPLVGGSGGGGGASTLANAGCGGSGGGGGGGGLLVAANGTITINGQINADGGSVGSSFTTSCASAGGTGSGGAVRLLATTISGSGDVFARGGQNPFTGARGPNGGGAIRMEALTNTFGVSTTDPLATRAPAPGPLVNPITPTVAITSVGGQPVPSPPQGGFGVVDVVLAAPGQTDISLSTFAVPLGTTVQVTVKPRVGVPLLPETATLTNCDPTGACLASVTFQNLPAGAYVIEARATFQTQ